MKEKLTWTISARIIGIGDKKERIVKKITDFTIIQQAKSKSI